MKASRAASGAAGAPRIPAEAQDSRKIGGGPQSTGDGEESARSGECGICRQPWNGMCTFCVGDQFLFRATEDDNVKVPEPQFKYQQTATTVRIPSLPTSDDDEVLRYLQAKKEERESQGLVQNKEIVNEYNYNTVVILQHIRNDREQRQMGAKLKNAAKTARKEATARFRGEHEAQLRRIRQNLAAERLLATYEVLVRDSDLSNSSLAENERLRRAENLLATYKRLRKVQSDFKDNSEQLVLARSIVNRHNYGRRMSKKAGTANGAVAPPVRALGRRAVSRDRKSVP